MTRKTALSIAIKTLESLENADFTGILHKLRELYDEMPLSKWTERSIQDAIAQWIEENRKQPSIYDLDHSYMPSHTTIKHILKLNAKVYLERHFPNQQRTTHSPYGEKSVDELLDLFKQEYARLNSPSANDFNKLRQKDTPCWQTYAELLSPGTTWIVLITYCNLDPHKAKVVIPKRLTAAQGRLLTTSTNYENMVAAFVEKQD
jgi:hypothetical protein